MITNLLHTGTPAANGNGSNSHAVAESPFPIAVAEMRERYLRLYTGAVNDVLRFNYNMHATSLPPEFAPLRESMKMAGLAFTVKGGPDITTDGEFEMRAQMLEDLHTDSVVVWDCTGDCVTSQWGEVMTMAATRAGCRGAVVNGIRDTQAILEQGFPVFHKYRANTGMLGRFRMHHYQKPVLMGEVTVKPGDWVFGDIDGVISIPQNIAYDVLLAAEKILHKEDEIREMVESGMKPTDVVKNGGYFLNMAVFLSDTERSQILTGFDSADPLLSRFYAALHKRVYERTAGAPGATKGLLGPDATVAWYYPAAEYLSDAAMLYALQPERRTADERVGTWLRTVTLDIARTPTYDWVGPAFRDHSEPLTGHLETAHLCWALSAVYDLARDAFSEAEQAEIRQALTEKGITLCRRWIDKNTHLANWRGILMSGVLVSAAVLGAAGDPAAGDPDEALVDEYVMEWQRCALAFQPDGSNGESLQYGNYLAYALMLAHEALSRAYPEKAALLDVGAYSKGIRWVTSSMFYAKPLAGGSGYDWGTEPRARAANFNDSAALFRPSGDLLLHQAVRGGSDEERGLARYLFDTYYAPVPTQGPHELASFGMNNDWGFLTLPLLTHESQSVSPQDARLPLTHSFSNGHAFMRDAWDGRTIVAINGGGDALHGPGHLHGDLNSFILVHNRERLLVDPGHSCYRNLIHGLESSTQTHNTCTFLVEAERSPAETLGLQEDKAKAVMLEQKSVLPRRLLVNGTPGAPVDRGNRRLLAERDDAVSVVGSEIGKACGAPIKQFTRLWLLAGSHVLFVVDRIEATQPVTTIWNWLVNNRDGQARTDSQDNRPVGPCLTVRRNESGMKLFHTGEGTIGYPVYGYVHDAYHVEPNQYGEGKPGSGLLYRWTEPVPALNRTMVHAIALDEAILLDRWQLETDDNAFTLTNGEKKWTLIVQDEAAHQLSLISGHGRRWDVRQEKGQYVLNRV